MDLRVHHRSMMQAAGLDRIVALCRTFGVSSIDTQLDILEQTLEDDEKKLREHLDQEILKDLANPEDVYNAIAAKTSESKAKDYFLSMMQHLLLIREEGPGLVHYFQLIDSMVTDLVMDKKLGGAEQRLGHSVERIIAQFNEADRYQHVEDDLAKANSALLKLKLEKESLEEEISQGDNGLVGVLKGKLAHMEDKLQVSRENTQRIQGQMEAQKAGYEEQIAQLEAQIMELFRMLKEVGKGVEKIDKIIENSGGMDRKTLIETLEKHLQRDKTISILEGRGGALSKKLNGKGIADSAGDSGSAAEGSGDDDTTPRKSGSLKRRPNSTVKSRSKVNGVNGSSVRVSEGQGGRASQFMDADESLVQEEIQQQLAQGNIVSAFVVFLSAFQFTMLSSTLHVTARPTAHEVYVVHRDGR